MKTLYLHRQDLRLFDNPALSAANEVGGFVPLYVCPEELGGASEWWLHHSLAALKTDYAQYGAELVLRSGDVVSQVLDVAKAIGANQVVWNRVYTPQGIELGQQLKAALAEQGIMCRSFNAQLLLEPAKALNLQGKPYKVFTPFWRAARQMVPLVPPLDIPSLNPLTNSLPSESLDAWNLLPSSPDWAQGLREAWKPGEQSAQKRWQAFLNDGVKDYAQLRDFPSVAANSSLSPSLAFGEISARQIWFEGQAAISEGRVGANQAEAFLRQLGWREFCSYLLFHFPDIEEQPFNSKFAPFEWQDNKELLVAWQRGETGYPIVDAGMRELWHTGIMHNRVRMIVASFLTKHCLIHWQQGADWFWDTLVDADLANNVCGWQWVAGCGADAAPYFRIFNPVLQSEKFDAKGLYLRRWLPELSQLDNKAIHQPWAAKALPPNFKLGRDYPNPVVDHKSAREAALAAYANIK